MKDLEIIIDPRVKQVFDNYPNPIRNKILKLRELVVKTAKETDGVNKIEETIKWGEPSYLTKDGSTIRIDWKERNPEQYAMYFKCTSKLVPTFKAIYKDKFIYEKDRAILFDLHDKLPEIELRNCIRMALTYHKIKHLHLLGS